MVFKGGNREHDRIRNLLKALNPEIDIMEVPHYDAETVNMCQSMNRIIVATKKTRVNESLVFNNIKWTYKNPYGLIYPLDANDTINYFVNKIHEYSKKCGK